MNENAQATQATQGEGMTPATVQAEGNRYAINTSGATSAPVFTTLDVQSAKGKKNLYNMTNHPDHTIADYINKPIRIKDIYVDVNNRVNKDENDPNYGTVEEKPRTIIIDDKGESYIAGVSVGIFQSIREIIKIFGTPDTWDEPLEVMVVQVRTPKGNMLSLEVV